jgi:hypothetical protein
MSGGPLTHADQMRSIELLGKEVLPRAPQRELAAATA